MTDFVIGSDHFGPLRVTPLPGKVALSISCCAGQRDSAVSFMVSLCDADADDLENTLRTIRLNRKPIITKDTADE